jgi:hypothetical protein
MSVAAPPLAAAIRPASDRDDGATERPATPVGRMIDALVRARPRTAAHALWILRRAFSDYPLAIRMVALAATMKDFTP